ncbi:MAG TPA: hypothetical protein VKF59_12360 [Candidatus Dormibacteraeota bacterium]|nr:hypothetical protein [Candidatus Dormibacteraeota bacterium]
MRRDEGLARRGARRRAATQAITLAAVIDQLLEAEATHVPMSAGAGTRHAVILRRGQIRNALSLLEEALAYGLDFDFVPPAELSGARAHTRNVAQILRLRVTAALSLAPDLPSNAGHLRAARQLAVELLESLGHIQRWVLEVEADALPSPWAETWSGRLLRLAALALPTGQRRDFIEDQCGNLAAIESPRERARYLLGLMGRMSEIAAACR